MSLSVSALNHAMNVMSDMPDAHSLEDIFSKVYAENSLRYNEQKTDLLYRISQPENASNPEDLYKYQTQVSEYNLNLSLYAALARKAVTAVDTLIRA